MKQITYQDIVNLEPCLKHYPNKYIPESWTGTMLDILMLPNVAPEEKLWVAYRVLGGKVLRLFAVDCARRALAGVAKPDIRSFIAVNMAEAYAYSRCSAGELAKARLDARAAVYAAYAAAADAADAAAAITAYAAAADNAYATAAAVYAADNAYATAAAVYAADARRQERERQVIELIQIIEKEDI